MIKTVKYSVSLLLCMTCSLFSVKAKIRLPALISDNMVLQQQADIALWGWAEPGERITVQPSWQKKPISAKALPDGTWKVQVKVPQADGKELSIQFSAGDTVLVQHILAGEVWLASGQSNMEFYVGKGTGWRTGVNDYETEIAKADYPLIRMIDVPNIVADSQANNFEGQWKVCSPATVADFSAVAYYFAVNIQKQTGYPVGIVNATWGGTPAESWTKKTVLEADTGFRHILERYATACAAYPEKYAAYKIKQGAWKADTSAKKKGAPKEPVGPKHNKSPGKLYNGMIAPLLPYHFKGVIWYQGESNATYAWQYRRLFPAMIRSWRHDWGNPNLPFYFVQIAPHKGQNPVIREAQLYSWQTTPNTGMVVTTDIGNANDIHPRNKKTVGDRLALWALKKEYGHKHLEASGPVYQSMKVEGNKIVISFDHAAGLYTKGSVIKEFTIAAADQNFIAAQAVIHNNRITVWSDSIKNPVAVRFAWKNVPEPNLFNKADLPASPFRTDQWEVETQGME
jgi:sialate O-acetylesterase